jgi:hypothetical protein
MRNVQQTTMTQRASITYLTAWNIRAAKSAYRNPEV